MDNKNKIPVTELFRKEDNKLVTMKGLREANEQELIKDDTLYPYRQSENDEVANAWIMGKELKKWIEMSKDKKFIEQYEYEKGEREWRMRVLNTIEPNMTKERADELKIVIKIQLLDEQYQITMDGKPIGEPYPMRPGMIDAIMWGKPSAKDNTAH